MVINTWREWESVYMSEGNAVEVIRLVCYFVTPFTFPSTEYCDLALYRFKRQENKDVLCSLKKNYLPLKISSWQPLTFCCLSCSCSLFPILASLLPVSSENMRNWARPRSGLGMQTLQDAHCYITNSANYVCYGLQSTKCCTFQNASFLHAARPVEQKLTWCNLQPAWDIFLHC